MITFIVLGDVTLRPDNALYKTAIKLEIKAKDVRQAIEIAEMTVINIDIASVYQQ